MEVNSHECTFINRTPNFNNAVTRVSTGMQIAKVPKDIFDKIRPVMNDAQIKMENNLSLNQFLQIIKDILLETKERTFIRQNNMVRTLKLDSLNGVSGYAISSIIVFVGLAITFAIIFIISKVMIS